MQPSRRALGGVLVALGLCLLAPLRLEAQSFARTGTLEFSPNEKAVGSVVVDTAAGNAYFGATSFPGRIVKVRLSDFTRQAALTLPAGEDQLKAAVIDPAGGHAYFATFSSGAVVKVRLSDFQKIHSLKLNAGEEGIRSAVIDPDGNAAYFGIAGAPGKVVKVRLSDMTRQGGFTLASGENDPEAAAIDPAGGFAYFATRTSPSRVVKVRLSDFTRVGALTLSAGEENVAAAALDASAGALYLGTETSPGRVVKVALASFTRAGALTLDSGEDGIVGAALDAAAQRAYFAASDRIVKVDLSSFTRVGALALEPGETGPTAAGIDPAGGYAYFGTEVQPGKLVRVRLSDFTRQGAVETETGESPPHSAVIDAAGGNAFFGIGTSPGKVVKVALGTFTRSSGVTMGEGIDDLAAGVLDGSFAYFASSTVPSTVVKVQLSDLTTAAALALDAGEGPVRSAGLAVGAAVLGTDTVPGRAVVVALPGLTRVGAVTLNPGEDRLYSVAVDTTADVAYFGTGTSPGRVVKVAVAGPSRVAALTLNTGEDLLSAAVLDPSGGHAYFGTRTSPGRVVKVRLSDFTRIGALTLPEGEVVSATLDGPRGIAYFGCGVTSGAVVAVRLSDFSRIGNVTFDAGEVHPLAGVLDPAAKKGYFGLDGVPGAAVRLSLFTPPDSAPAGLGASVTTTTALWTWSPVTGATEYRFYPSTGGPAVVLDTTTLLTEGLGFNAPASGRVSAANAAGEGPLSASVTAYTLAAAPTDVGFFTVHVTSAEFSFNGPNPAGTQYEFSLASDAGFSAGVSTPIAFSAVTVPSTTTLTGLAAQTAYHGRVRARNAAGVATAFVSSRTATLPDSGADPSTTSVTATSLAWAWAAEANANFYRVYSTTATPPQIGAPASPAWQSTRLATNTAYGLSASVVTHGGEGPVGTPAVVYTLAAAPAQLQATQYSSTGAVALSWAINGNPLATQYEVTASSDGFNALVSTPVPFSTGFSSPATVAFLLPAAAGRGMAFRVRARNGDGVPTAAVEVSTGLVAPGATAVPVSTGTAGAFDFVTATGTVAVAVSSSAFAAPVTLTLAPAGAVAAAPPGLSAAGFAFDLSAGGVQPAAPLTLRVCYAAASLPAGADERLLTLARGAGSSWAPLTTTVDTAAHCATASTDHLSLFGLFLRQLASSASEAVLYPNPVRAGRAGHDRLNAARVPAGARLRVYTASGELVRTLTADGFGNASWDLRNDAGHHVASGVYLVLIDGGGKIVQKVGIQR